MSRFFTPTVESIGPGASVQAAGDGLEGHYKAFLNSVPSNGSCLVIVPGLDPLHHMEANCPANAVGSVGDEVFVGFDDEKSLWVVTPTTQTTEINGVPVPLTGAAWHTPTLLNSWVVIGLGLASPGYLKNPLGFVHAKGRVKNGTTGTVAFVFPPGFRPGGIDTYPSAQGNLGTAFIVVDTSGNVTIDCTSTTDIGLAGITFLAEN